MLFMSGEVRENNYLVYFAILMLKCRYYWRESKYICSVAWGVVEVGTNCGSSEGG